MTEEYHWMSRHEERYMSLSGYPPTFTCKTYGEDYHSNPMGPTGWYENLRGTRPNEERINFDVWSNRPLSTTSIPYEENELPPADYRSNLFVRYENTTGYPVAGDTSFSTSSIQRLNTYNERANEIDPGQNTSLQLASWKRKEEGAFPQTLQPAAEDYFTACLNEPLLQSTITKIMEQMQRHTNELLFPAGSLPLHHFEKLDDNPQLLKDILTTLRRLPVEYLDTIKIQYPATAYIFRALRRYEIQRLYENSHRKNKLEKRRQKKWKINETTNMPLQKTCAPKKKAEEHGTNARKYEISDHTGRPLPTDSASTTVQKSHKRENPNAGRELKTTPTKHERVTRSSTRIKGK